MLQNIGLLGTIGSIGALIGFLFWQARRAATATDANLAAVKVALDLELQLAARGRAVDERDRTIVALRAENARLVSANAELASQRDQLVASLSPKDSNAAVDAIRTALAPEPAPLPPPPVRGK
jgi:hypothetical protein